MGRQRAVMWWWGGEHMGAAAWIGLIFMIIFWVAFIVAIVLLIRRLVGRSFSGYSDPYRQGGSQGRGEGGWTYRPDALQILEERYARGEIERDEFLRRRDDLLGRP